MSAIRMLGAALALSVLSAVPAALSPTPARADGPDWSAFGSESVFNNYVNAVAVSGTDVYVGGGFTNVAGIPQADYVVRWDGSQWNAVGADAAGTDGALNNFVNDIVVANGIVYVGGNFTNAGGDVTADHVAQFSGGAWSGLGSINSGTDGAVPGMVQALAVVGGTVYVGGTFQDVAGEATADYIARWTGSEWEALGSNGSGNGAFTGAVYEIAVSGTNVYAGGFFFDVAGLPTADGIALWNGDSWSGLGSNGSGNGAVNGQVYSIVISGSRVLVGGNFDGVGGPLGDYVVEWNGSTWSALGSDESGTNGALQGLVHTLVLANGYLYAGGEFVDYNSVASRLARWDGSTWIEVDDPDTGSPLNASVNALTVKGSELIVGGNFLDGGSVAAADQLAKYGPLPSLARPDARIRKGSAAFVGNNIYNADGAGQTRQGAKPRGGTVTFGISLQNDSSLSGRITVASTGAPSTMYSVRYFRGTTEITTAVVGGTYQTPNLSPGGTFLITAKVKVKSNATAVSSVTRLVTASAQSSPTVVDAVKFIVKRS